MRAAIVRAFQPFQMAEFGHLPDPLAGDGEVVIDVAAADVNYPDILVMEGKYQRKPPLPFSPGMGAAGRISAVGSSAGDFAVGDRVAVQMDFGAFAQKVRVPAASCCRLPAKMPFEIGAALGLAYQTAHYALFERARLLPGETVLVLGAAGGVGAASVQLAKVHGASKVIGTARGPERVSFARQVGCDHVIDLNMGNLRDGVRDEVHALTAGRGVDVVIDPVGGEAHAAALRAMAWRARMVIVGFASGTIPQIKANYLLLKNISLLGLQWTDYRDREPARVCAVSGEIYSLWEAGKLVPPIAKTLQLAQFVEAISDLTSGAVPGKVVLTTVDV